MLCFADQDSRIHQYVGPCHYSMIAIIFHPNWDAFENIDNYSKKKKKGNYSRTASVNCPTHREMYIQLPVQRGLRYP